MTLVVVEGPADVEAAKKVVLAGGLNLDRSVVVKHGVGNLDRDLPKYGQVAQREICVVFRDSDRDCPVALVESLRRSLPIPQSELILRIARPQMEAWLLADDSAFSSFFGVEARKIRADPELLPDAKQEVLRLCTSSKKRAVRTGAVTRRGEVGPLYVDWITRFSRDAWNPLRAAQRSPSLASALRRIQGAAEVESPA